MNVSKFTLIALTFFSCQTEHTPIEPLIEGTLSITSYDFQEFSPADLRKIRLKIMGKVVGEFEADSMKIFVAYRFSDMSEWSDSVTEARKMKTTWEVDLALQKSNTSINNGERVNIGLIVTTRNTVSSDSLTPNLTRMPFAKGKEIINLLVSRPQIKGMIYITQHTPIDSTLKSITLKITGKISKDLPANSTIRIFAVYRFSNTPKWSSSSESMANKQTDSTWVLDLSIVKPNGPIYDGEEIDIGLIVTTRSQLNPDSLTSDLSGLSFALAAVITRIRLSRPIKKPVPLEQGKNNAVIPLTGCSNHLLICLTDDTSPRLKLFDFEKDTIVNELNLGSLSEGPIESLTGFIANQRGTKAYVTAILPNSDPKPKGGVFTIDISDCSNLVKERCIGITEKARLSAFAENIAFVVGVGSGDKTNYSLYVLDFPLGESGDCSEENKSPTLDFPGEISAIAANYSDNTGYFADAQNKKLYTAVSTDSELKECNLDSLGISDPLRFLTPITRAFAFGSDFRLLGVTTNDQKTMLYIINPANCSVEPVPADSIRGMARAVFYDEFSQTVFILSDDGRMDYLTGYFVENFGARLTYLNQYAISESARKYLDVALHPNSEDIFVLAERELLRVKREAFRR